jgi:hypothetical protein
MVAAGRGDERASFIDMNIRGSFSINMTAAIYLSFFDPTGPRQHARQYEPAARAALMDRRHGGSVSDWPGLCLQPGARQPAEPLRHGRCGPSRNPYRLP